MGVGCCVVCVGCWLCVEHVMTALLSVDCELSATECLLICIDLCASSPRTELNNSELEELKNHFQLAADSGGAAAQVQSITVSLALWLSLSLFLSGSVCLGLIPKLLFALSHTLTHSHNHTLTHLHTHTLTITCTCCYDEIKGTQDLEIYFMLILSDFLSLSLSPSHFLCLFSTCSFHGCIEMSHCIEMSCSPLRSCPFTLHTHSHNHTLTHSLSLALVAMMRSLQLFSC